jgi:hypothetical protein
MLDLLPAIEDSFRACGRNSWGDATRPILKILPKKVDNAKYALSLTALVN